MSWRVVSLLLTISAIHELQALDICSRKGECNRKLPPMRSGNLWSRRSIFAVGGLCTCQSPGILPAKEVPFGTIDIPIEYSSRVSAYIVRYTVGGDEFAAIVDTGSPFLTIPSHCRGKWGCYNPEHSTPSGLAPTIERFDNNQGRVTWRQASLSLGGRLLRDSIVFGVLDESLMDGPGGVFLGLVRDTDWWIRPSFLGQLGVSAFQVDLINKKLVLSSDRIPSSSTDTIPLVRDLNKMYKDPTVHYTAKVHEISVNGAQLANDGRPIYAIFDTGVTGMVVSRELFEERLITARSNREKNLWGNVTLEFKTHPGSLTTLTATKPLTTPLGEMPWKSFKAHLVVLGLSFLNNTVTTIDIDKGTIQIENYTADS